MRERFLTQIKLDDKAPKICVSFFGEDFALAKDMYRSLKEEAADILEWRLDYLMGEAYRDTSAIEAFLGELRREGEERPLILTLRTEEEGGRARLSSREYRNIIRDLITDTEADAIDMEAFDREPGGESDVVAFLTSLAHENDKAVILSNHDYTGMPSQREILSRLLAMEKLGADVPKAAYMARTKEEAETLLSAAQEAGEILSVPFIALAMGEAGTPTRIAAGLFGSCITFAAAGRGGTAPGQLSVAETRQHLKTFYQ